MSLYYDSLRLYWAVVIKKKSLNIVFAKVPFLLAGILNDKSGPFKSDSILIIRCTMYKYKKYLEIKFDLLKSGNNTILNPLTL